MDDLGNLLETIEPVEERGPIAISGEYMKIFIYGASSILGIAAVLILLLIEVLSMIFNPNPNRSFDAFLRIWVPLTALVAAWTAYSYYAKLKPVFFPGEPEPMQILDIYQRGIVLRTEEEEQAIPGILMESVQILFDIDNNGNLVFDGIGILTMSGVTLYKTVESKAQYAYDAIRGVAARALLPSVMERLQDEPSIVFEDFELMPEGIGVLSYNPLKPLSVENVFVAYRDFEALRWNWPHSVLIIGQGGQKLARLVALRRFPEDEPKKTNAAINPNIFYLDLAILIGRKHRADTQLEDGGEAQQLPG